jgi:outer membrane biosynthesis protein TonB
MKAGLTTSVILHAAVIGFGLVSLSPPSTFDVADVESFPVDIIPVESITQIMEGDKKSPAEERPAPLPTEKPALVPDAQEIGENKVDTDKAPTPDPKPKPVEATAAPAPAPEPKPKPIEPEPKPVEEPDTKVAAVPATEVTPVPEPQQDVKPDPVPETVVAETPEAESIALPDTAPSPSAKPQPPQAQTAKAPDRKDAEKPTVKAAEKPKSEEKDFNEDEITALLNKEQASGGGAKRSTETAALGGERKTSNVKLSQSEMDSLRGQIQRCWVIPAGAVDAENLRISVQFKLDESGALDGEPTVVRGGGREGVQLVATEAALRAVRRCGPYNLPADKYEAWADVIVNFDPSEMF